MEVWVRGWMDQMVNENQTDLIGQSRISNVFGLSRRSNIFDWLMKTMMLFTFNLAA
jgi:hypothetical protein